MGRGKNEGLRNFAMFRLCSSQGHRCFTNTCLVLVFVLTEWERLAKLGTDSCAPDLESGYILVRCIPLSLRPKTQRRVTLLLPNWIYSCQSVETVNFTLPFTTSVTISIFHITNFPFLSSNIPSSPVYGVFIPQLIRYAKACSSYECFILRAVQLSIKLLGQGYVMGRLRSSLRKFYGRYGDLIK